MFNRLSKILALMSVSAVLAFGGAGLALASPDNSGHHSNDHCKKLHGKKRKHCEKEHHGNRHR